MAHKTFTRLFLGLISTWLSEAKDEQVYDVLVLGAGAAGVGAARELCGNGVKFLVLEGRDEIGGRVKSLNFNGTTVEEGAGWTFKSKREAVNPIYEAGQDLVPKLNIKPSGLESIRSLPSGDVPWKDIDNEIKCVRRKAKKIQKKHDKFGSASFMTDEANFACPAGQLPRSKHRISSFKSLSQTLRQDCDWSPKVNVDYTLNWYAWTWDYAAPPSKLGTLGTNYFERDKYKFSNAKFVYDQRGFASTLEELGGTCLSKRLRLRHKVTKIEYTATDITVTVTVAGKHKEFKAKHVISTFSTGVLAHDTSLFKPALPEWKQNAITKFPMGHMTKIFVKTRENLQVGKEENFILSHLRAMDGLGSGPNSRKISIWQNYNMISEDFKDKNILCGFLAGVESEAFDDLSQSEKERKVIAYVKEMYTELRGGNSDGFSGFVEHIFVTNWSKDEFTRGAYSYRPLKTHNSEAYTLAYPVENVWFAGEATSPTMSAYVHGAAISGKNTAAMVISCLDGRCPPDFEDIEIQKGCKKA